MIEDKKITLFLLKMKKITRLVWYRNDLRVQDNPALYYACKNFNGTVIALFIDKLFQSKKENASKKKIIFLYNNLLELQKSLFCLGIDFVYRKFIDVLKMQIWLKNFCQSQNIKEIFYNRQYAYDEIKMDIKIRNLLEKKVFFYAFENHFLFYPNSILNSHGKMYKIFSPFHQKIIKKLQNTNFYLFPIPENRARNFTFKKYSFQLKKLDRNIEKIFPAGEKFAHKRLYFFYKKKINRYSQFRNIVFNCNGSSFLSPYINLGVISSRQCLFFLKQRDFHFLDRKNKSFFWVKEIIWREFYHHLVYFYPFLYHKRPFIQWTEKILWNKSKIMFNSWKQGMTGYPIIDAIMRQLNCVGWIDNRSRMLSASFLVKNLLIDWRRGEQYFMSQLIDGDFCSNNGNWQWIASTGSSHISYFKIFNPMLQKSNPSYIRYWVPELKKVPDKYMQFPHKWAFKNQYKLRYPFPIVNYEKSCEITKMMYKNAKNSFFHNKVDD